MTSSSSTSTSDTRLFIGRLAPTVQTRDLEELFGRYGTISNCSLKTSYGFVEYEDPRDARDAMRELDGYRLEGTKIAVEFSHGRRNDRENQGRDPRDNRERDRGDRGGRDYRSERHHHHHYDHRDRDYDRERDYDRDYRDHGRRYSNRGRYSPPYNTEFRISVTGLPQGCSWQDLKDHFRQIGEVCFADVRRDRDGKETGVVEFKRLEDMKEALRKLDRTRLRGSILSVYCEFDGGGKYSPRSRSRSGSRSRRRSRRVGGSPRSSSKHSSPRSSPAGKLSKSQSPAPRSKSQSTSPRKSGSASPKKGSDVPAGDGSGGGNEGGNEGGGSGNNSPVRKRSPTRKSSHSPSPPPPPPTQSSPSGSKNPPNNDNEDVHNGSRSPSPKKGSVSPKSTRSEED